MKLYEKYEGKKLWVAEKIQRRRLQILVHSYIYYELNENIISDATWSEWAKELAELQDRYPNMSKKIVYAEQFEGWDGSTGAFLEYDKKIRKTAKYLLKIQNKKQNRKIKSQNIKKSRLF